MEIINIQASGHYCAGSMLNLISSQGEKNYDGDYVLCDTHIVHMQDTLWPTRETVCYF